MDFLVGHMANEQWSGEQVRTFLEGQLPKLKHWSRENGQST